MGGTASTGGTTSADALGQARRRSDAGDVVGAVAALARIAVDPVDPVAWSAADRILARLGAAAGPAPWARRSVEVALLVSHTGGPLAAALRVAGIAHGLDVRVHETPYHSYEQEIADASSGLYASAPDVVVLVVDQRDVRLPDVSQDPDADLAREVGRWRGMWDLVRGRSGALVLQTSFVPPPHDALGDVAVRTPGSRRRLLSRLNDELAVAGVPGVHVVDADAVVRRVGESAWQDPRYWFAAKQTVAPGAVPVLAHRVVDVMAAALGLARKVVVLDLDDTLWGGVIGEDGLGGIVLGDGPAGEAYVAFQEYVSSLRRRGLLLAVCTKNNPDDARLPFQRHPEMRLTLDDVVAFEASWDPKPQALARIAASLDLGLDALVLVDDNPAEREIVRRLTPEVGVVELPTQPSGYVAALASFPGLQSASLTGEDARRTEQYRARGRASALAAGAGTREDFLQSLGMTARIEALDDVNVARVAQLVAKTNQLNLTGRRHGVADLNRLADQGLVWGLRLTDRFDDHGLVGVLAAVPDGPDLRIDTFVMSCRVLGRTAERAFLAALVGRAHADGRARVLGELIPTDRNVPARSILPDAGFRPLHDPDRSGADGVRWWQIAVPGDGVSSPFVPWWAPDGLAGGGEPVVAERAGTEVVHG
ncbi:HAD-IIIC family phosphatase [Cellulosimicrobium terreum]|nr:HAD-IIIC family phosphatase [Cellulosimicrobium terreum]